MSRIAGWCALGLLVLLCASFCQTRLAEVDLHWHLLAGERILQERQAPRVDRFTYTSGGRPWIDLHWLYQVLLALVYRAAGWAGVDRLKTACITGAFVLALLAGARRGASPLVLAAAGLPALVAAQERFTMRPEALSFLFLAALLLILGERRRHPGSLWLVPPLLALWANCHALYSVGAAVVVLVTIGDIIPRLFAARSVPPAQAPAAGAARPVSIAALSLAATALTPYGLQGWRLPWTLLSRRIAAENLYGSSIAEFQSPFGGYGPTTAIAAFGVLIVVLSLAFVVGRRGIAGADLCVLLPLLALALLARRNIPLFALASIPCGAGSIQATFRRIGVLLAARGVAGARLLKIAPGLLTLVIGAATTWLLADVWSNAFFVRDGTQRYFGRGEFPGFYPEGAAGFVLRSEPSGEVLNDMTMGGYLAWRWYPRRRTFIDGRLEVHDEELYRSFLRLQQEPEEFERITRRLGIDTVLWSHRHAPDAVPLLRYLAGDHGWKPVYVDLAASVFRRAGAAGTAPAIDLTAASLTGTILREIDQAGESSARLDPAPAWLRRVLPRRESPVAVVNAALFFAAVGSGPVAEGLFRRALSAAPDNPVIRYDLALVLQQSGRGEASLRELEAALRIDARFSPARQALALQLAKSGDTDAALREWGEAERSGSLDRASLVARGAVFAARGRIDEAIGDYRRAIDMAPRDAGLHANLGLLCLRQGLREEAAAEIARSLALDPSGCAPRVARARMEAAEGKRDQAEAHLREAASGADGPCPEAEHALEELHAAPRPGP